jgi:hypothetical protein
MLEGCSRSGVAVWACRPMQKHVHSFDVPRSAEGLRFHHEVQRLCEVNYHKPSESFWGKVPDPAQNAGLQEGGFSGRSSLSSRLTRSTTHAASPALMRVNWSTATARTITTPITIN